MLLSKYLPAEKIYKDGEFNDLGYSNSSGTNILTFCDNLNYLTIAIDNKNISSIIIKKELLPYIKDIDKAIVLCENPRNTFFNLYNLIRENKLFNIEMKYGLGKNVTKSESAVVSQKSYIGDNTIISDNVTIKENVFIGKNCYIDSGAVLGNDGILYMQKDDNNIFIRHAGIVKIGDNVSILSNATIVKSIFPNMPTIIDNYSIIGIATTIGHEAKIGKNCRILGNCVVAKNAYIGDRSIVGSSSVIRENISIGNDVDIKAGTIVIKNIKDHEVISGNFGMNHTLNVKNYFKSQK